MGEKLEFPNFGAGVRRQPLLVGLHVSLAAETHAVIMIDNQPQMAATVVAAVPQDACQLARKFLCRSIVRLMCVST